MTGAGGGGAPMRRSYNLGKWKLQCHSMKYNIKQWLRLQLRKPKM